MGAAENEKRIQGTVKRIKVGAGRSFVEHLAEDVTTTATSLHCWSETFGGKTSVLKDLYR